MLSNSSTFLTTVLALASMAIAAPAANSTKPGHHRLSVTAQLQLADTAVDRYKILSKDKDFVFDLGQNNGLAIANRQTFPALVGTGTSFTIAKFEGCSISKLHIHPRAAEMQIVLSGHLMTQTIPEFGVVDAKGKPRVIHTDLTTNMMTVFHQGAFHTQINPECEPATSITAFNSEDGGFGFIADQVFALDNDILGAQLGNVISGADIDLVRQHLPQGFGARIDACLKKCNIPKRQVKQE